MAWHGHSCFEVHDGLVVVMDPHDGKSIGIKPPVVKADICLISHDHFDHNCSRIVRGDPTVVKEAGERIVKGLNIRGMSTFHDEEEGAKRGLNVVFRFEMDDVSFVHLGDLGQELTDEEIASLGRVDVLFIPVGGVFTIDHITARRLIDRINPKVAIPMHYQYGGLSISISPVETFLEDLAEESILRVGNEIEFAGDELPMQTEYWVFSP
ncbi:MAG: MBL fold metallo-hydrolase [Euryarchaeota archaeon]|nr:MBL fold metallo-hydrolase [Euryarchaeota archaeon]